MILESRFIYRILEKEESLSINAKNRPITDRFFIAIYIHDCLQKLITYLTRFAKFCLLSEKRNYNRLWFLEKTDSDFSPNLLNDKI